MNIMIVPFFIISVLIAAITGFLQIDSLKYGLSNGIYISVNLSNIKYIKYVVIDMSVIFILGILLCLIGSYRSRREDKKAIEEFNKGGNTSKVIERDIPIRELNIPENYILIDRKTLKVVSSKAMFQFKCYLKYNFLFTE